MVETWFDSWVGKISWRRKWQRTPVFLPGESHGYRGAWQATVHGVSMSQTWLSDKHTKVINKWNYYGCYSDYQCQICRMPNAILHWYVKFFVYFFDPSLFWYAFLNSDFQTYSQGIWESRSSLPNTWNIAIFMSMILFIHSKNTWVLCARIIEGARIIAEKQDLESTV